MTLTLIDIITIASIVWLPFIIKWYLSQRAKDKSEIENGEWIQNKGSRPAIFNVDIVLKNGQLKKYVSAKSVNWDLLAKNPVVKYRKALKG
ncbi:hypothetical protein ACTBJ2_004514 [Vibrio parahaemolyticus]